MRGALGIAMQGKGTIGFPVHLFFRAPDLLAASARDPATFFFLIDREGLWGSLRIIDPVNGFWRLMQDRTAIIIAHRLSTVETADRVLVVHDGRVVEDGTPEQLIGDGGAFARLHGAWKDSLV